MATKVLPSGTYFCASKLSAFDQLHVARKLGPAVPMVEGLLADRNSEKPRELLFVLMLAHLSDESTDYVLRKCLSVVCRRQSDGTAAKLQTPDGALMFDDVSMADLLQLTVMVIDENLGDFFRTALAGLEAQAGA